MSAGNVNPAGSHSAQSSSGSSNKQGNPGLSHQARRAPGGRPVAGNANISEGDIKTKIEHVVDKHNLTKKFAEMPAFLEKLEANKPGWLLRVLMNPTIEGPSYMVQILSGFLLGSFLLVIASPAIGGPLIFGLSALTILKVVGMSTMGYILMETVVVTRSQQYTHRIDALMGFANGMISRVTDAASGSLNVLLPICAAAVVGGIVMLMSPHVLPLGFLAYWVGMAACIGGPILTIKSIADDAPKIRKELEKANKQIIEGLKENYERELFYGDTAPLRYLVTEVYNGLVEGRSLKWISTDAGQRSLNYSITIDGNVTKKTIDERSFSFIEQLAASYKGDPDLNPDSIKIALLDLLVLDNEFFKVIQTIEYKDFLTDNNNLSKNQFAEKAFEFLQIFNYLSSLGMNPYAVAPDHPIIAAMKNPPPPKSPIARRNSVSSLPPSTGSKKKKKEHRRAKSIS